MDPLIPRPWILFVVLVLLAFLGANLWLDYSSPDYSGSQFTYAICGLIASTLGFPIGFAAFRKPRDDRPESSGGDRP